MTFENHCYDVNLSKTSVTPEYWDSHDISDDYRNSSIFTAVTMLLFLLIGLPGNAVIIVTIVKKRLYRQITHILVLNLAIADFLLCLVTMPLTVVAGFAGGYIFGSSDHTRCGVCQIGVLLTFFSVFSVKMICLISLDRFIFVRFPLYYDRFVTKKKVVVIVLVLWLIAVLEAIPPLFGFGEIKYAFSQSSCYLNFFPKFRRGLYYSFILIALSVLPVVVTIVTTIWVACIARKQVRKIYGTRTGSTNHEPTEDQAAVKRNKKKMMRKQLMLIRAFGSILVGNIIIWSPVVVFSVVFLTVDRFSIPLGIYTCTYISFVMHAVLHPIIEGCFIPEIKAAFVKLLGFYRCRKLSRQIEPSKSTENVTLDNI